MKKYDAEGVAKYDETPKVSDETFSAISECLTANFLGIDTKFVSAKVDDNVSSSYTNPPASSNATLPAAPPASVAPPGATLPAAPPASVTPPSATLPAVPSPDDRLLHLIGTQRLTASTSRDKGYRGYDTFSGACERFIFFSSSWIRYENFLLLVLNNISQGRNIQE